MSPVGDRLWRKFREFGASLPAPGRGRSGLGGARASQAARPRARAREGRRAPQPSPPAAQPPAQRPEPTGPRLPALRPQPEPSHAVRGARCRRRGARRPRPHAAPLRPKFQPHKQFPERTGSGARPACPRRSERRPARWRQRPARLSARGHNFALRGRRRARERHFGARRAGAPRAQVRSPAPSATRRGGAAAAAPGSGGSRPGNSGGLRVPAGITCSRSLPAPRSAQPRLRLPRCSWRARGGRSRRAAAPQAEPPPPSLRPTRAHGQPAASAAAARQSPRQRPGPASLRATPSGHAHCARPRSTSAAAPQPGRWPPVWGRECGASAREGAGPDSKPRPVPPVASTVHSHVPPTPTVPGAGLARGGGGALRWWGERSEVIGCLGGIPSRPLVSAQRSLAWKRPRPPRFARHLVVGPWGAGDLASLEGSGQP